MPGPLMKFITTSEVEIHSDLKPLNIQAMCMCKISHEAPSPLLPNLYQKHREVIENSVYEQQPA